MSDIRDAVMARSHFTDDEFNQQIIAVHKLRVSTYGDKPTHAICRHGVVALIDADDHACGWLPLVAAQEQSSEGELKWELKIILAILIVTRLRSLTSRCSFC